ncbi:zinc-dependent alcohol dehydrogenase family protein [Rhodococcus xishaensis]|uniref:NAD(P)-dependent alcohol dehydrogenase n=1 Tax=Rhodococcus xishaensis TaxID=2487364 RepID=A0A3S3A5U4_9NOCA|nr:NAD(P)-dependent alcohol dehydrogenase [Rhodococcus xishaensis]RVW02761.1 NAD(P)-dependent alcohol dehydrogenase [Rhodococcus xishaensis]
MLSPAVYVVPPGGLDHLVTRDVATPEPQPGEVTIEVHANSLNHHDVLVASGAIETGEPRILLSDAAGEVVAVGEGESRFGLGDRVMTTYLPHWHRGRPTFDGFANSPGDGVDGYARRFVTIQAAALTAIPWNYSYAEAATLPTAGLSAWRALFSSSPLEPGQTVLVPGSSTVSLFAIQLAKAVGARVIGTSSSTEKMSRLLDLGVDAAVNYRDNPQWGREAFDLAGHGVDHVLDIGGPATLDQSLAAVKVGGRISALGIMAGASSTVDFTPLLTKQITIEGLLVGSREHQEEMVAGLEGLAVHPVIDSTYPLESLSDALRHQGSGRHFGKIVVTS